MSGLAEKLRWRTLLSLMPPTTMVGAAPSPRKMSFDQLRLSGEWTTHLHRPAHGP